MDYSKKTRTELIELCKEKKLKGYSTKKKDQLITLLEIPTESTTIVNTVIQPSTTKNNFYVGDNLDLLKSLDTESIDMIYMDPPYNTGRNFYYFEDKFADFPKFMEERIKECHRVLKKDGNIIIHVEPRISHHIRI